MSFGALGHRHRKSIHLNAERSHWQEGGQKKRKTVQLVASQQLDGAASGREHRDYNIHTTSQFYWDSKERP